MIEAILDQCMEDIRAQRATIADCLIKYSEYAEELKPLLEMAVAIEGLPEVKPSIDFKQRMRARLLFRTDQRMRVEPTEEETDMSEPFS